MTVVLKPVITKFAKSYDGNYMFRFRVLRNRVIGIRAKHRPERSPFVSVLDIPSICTCSIEILNFSEFPDDIMSDHPFNDKY